jgi:D-tyrosyl-tRNA(Tyr) deacylase
VRLVIQRVSGAGVSWEQDGVGQQRAIGAGIVVLVGVGAEDDEDTAERLAAKTRALRIFADADGRTNLSLPDVGGEALVISQFTLYADLSRGRRPSYIGAGPAEHADHLYQRFAHHLRAAGTRTETGCFGAHMEVEIRNDGPLTLVLSSDDWQARVPT